jgi:hypothetical protein
MSVRIFLSHASEDKPLIRSLHARLRAVGFKPWLDEIDLIPGMNWKDEIRRQIKECDVFLACLTQNSAKTGFVRSEFEYALEQYAMKRAGNIYLIPVKLSPCEIPPVYEEINHVNLRDFHWLEYYAEDGFEKLLRSIQVQTKFVVFSDWLRRGGFRLLLEKKAQYVCLELEKKGSKSWISVCKKGDLAGTRGYGRQKSEAIVEIIQQIEGKQVGWIDFDKSYPNWVHDQLPRHVLLGEIESYDDVILPEQ